MLEILGVRIDNLTWEEAEDKIREFLNDGKQHKIFTPNPEMLVLAHNLPMFKSTLNSSDLNLCDGFGITLVSKGKIKRIPGTDFIQTICKVASQSNKNLFLLGTNNLSILERVKEELNKQFVQLNISGVDTGIKIDIVEGGIKYDNEENNKLIQRINQSGAEILIVAFGQIKQEQWISQNLSKLNNVKVAIGVGGAFDFISGNIKRAPRILRLVGLEWLYRLFKEPRKRWQRIYNATFKFIFYWLKSIL